MESSFYSGQVCTRFKGYQSLLCLPVQKSRWKVLCYVPASAVWKKKCRRRHFMKCITNRLLHWKCTVRIFIYELQNFRNERLSVASEWVSKALQRVNKIRTKHFLWCNLFVVYIRPISCNKPSNGILSSSLYFTRWIIELYFTGLLHESGLIYIINRLISCLSEKKKKRERES